MPMHIREDPRPPCRGLGLTECSGRPFAAVALCFPGSVLYRIAEQKYNHWQGDLPLAPDAPSDRQTAEHHEPFRDLQPTAVWQAVFGRSKLTAGPGAVPAHDQPISIMLDLVHPAWPRRRLGGQGRDAGIDEAVGADAAGERAAKIGAPGWLV